MIENSLNTAEAKRDEVFLDQVAGSVHTLIGRSQKHPLLYELAKQNGYPLIVWGKPPENTDVFIAQLQKVVGPTSTLWFGSSAAPDYGEHFHDSELSLKDWMESPHLVVDGVSWSGEELLEKLRNKDFAHVDLSLPKDMAMLRKYNIGGLSSQYLAIVPMGKNVLTLGQRFLESLGTNQ